MTLLEDLDELRLLVPDAPSLLADVLTAARSYAEEAAHLVEDASQFQGQAADLRDRLQAELTLLGSTAQEVQACIESSIAGMSEAFGEILTALARERGELGEGENAAAENVQTLAAQASAAAGLLNAARKEAALAATQQGTLFEDQKVALENAMMDTGDALPLLDRAIQAASTAAEQSAESIEGHLGRLGPLAKGHLTDADDEVQTHLGTLCDAMNEVMESYGSGADEMGEELVEASDSAAAELVAAGEALDAAAWAAAQGISGSADRLAEQHETFATDRAALERLRDGLIPYVEAAYRAEERLTGAS